MKQNYKLSLSRRFRRWTRFHDDNIYLVLAILSVVLCIVLCVILHNKYGYELKSYDEADYKYLTSIVYTIWDEDTKSLKIDYIPDNVSITEAEISPSGTNFKCNLIGKTSIVPAPFVNVHISEDFIVDITHYTESKFCSYVKGEFVAFCVASCILCILVELLILGLFTILIYLFLGLYDLTKKFVTILNKS